MELFAKLYCYLVWFGMKATAGGRNTKIKEADLQICMPLLPLPLLLPPHHPRTLNRIWCKLWLFFTKLFAF